METHNFDSWHERVIGWVVIGTRTKVPLMFVIFLSKVSEIDEKNVLTQSSLHDWSQSFGSLTTYSKGKKFFSRC
jgi:hypothetical protein